MCFTSAEKFWKYVNNRKQKAGEQATLNYALQDYGVRWKIYTSVKNICRVLSGWQSYEPLNCMVFSQEDVCRSCCGNAQKHNYFILHPLTSKVPTKKKYYAQDMNVWHLRDNWKTLISSSSEGTLWLRSVSTLNDG